jgi:hypothetical protein
MYCGLQRQHSDSMTTTSWLMLFGDSHEFSECVVTPVHCSFSESYEPREYRLLCGHNSRVIECKVKLSRYTPCRQQRGIARIHSWPQLLMGWVVSFTPRPRFTPSKGPPVPIGQEAGWATCGRYTEVRGEIIYLCRGSNPDRPVCS